MTNQPEYAKWTPRTAKKTRPCSWPKGCAKPIKPGQPILDNNNGKRIHASHVRKPAA